MGLLLWVKGTEATKHCPVYESLFTNTITIVKSYVDFYQERSMKSRLVAGRGYRIMFALSDL